MSGQQRTGRALGEVLATIAVLGLALVVLADAMMRGLFDNPLSAVLPMVQYWFMPAIVFVGYVLAQLSDRHLQVELVFSRLRPGGQRILAGLGSLVSGVFVLRVASFAMDFAHESWAIKLADPISGVVTWPVTFIAPTSLVILGGLMVAAGARVLLTGAVKPDAIGSHHS